MLQNRWGKKQCLVLFAVAGISLLIRAYTLHAHSGLLESLWLFALCGAWLFSRLLRGELLPRRFDGLVWSAALMMAVSTYFYIVFREPGTSPISVSPLAAALAALAAYGLLIDTLCRADTEWLWERGETRGPEPRRLLLAGLLFGVILLVQYAFFFPYGKSPDTVNQWDQIHGTIPYNTIHAIGHTILLKLLLSLWDSYVFVVLVQMAAVLLLNLAFVRFFTARGVPFAPVVFALAMGLIWTGAATKAWFVPWKDTPAALCICLVTLILARYLEDGRLSLPRAACLGLLLAGCFVLRLNGIVALLICGGWALGAFLKKRQFRQLAAFLLGIALVIGGVSLYSARVLHPERSDNGFAIQIFGSAIAAVVHEDELTPEEEQELEALLPVDWMRENYGSAVDKRDLFWRQDASPRIAEDPDLAVFNNEFVIRMGENRNAVLRLFFRMLPRHFLTMAKDVLGSMAAVWGQQVLFFAGSHVFWAVFLACFALRKKLDRRDWLVFLPCICNTVSIMISTATNEMRYLLPTFMLAPFFLLFILLRTKRETAAPREKGREPAEGAA